MIKKIIDNKIDILKANSFNELYVQRFTLVIYSLVLAQFFVAILLGINIMFSQHNIPFKLDFFFMVIMFIMSVMLLKYDVLELVTNVLIVSVIVLVDISFSMYGLEDLRFIWIFIPPIVIFIFIHNTKLSVFYLLLHIAFILLVFLNLDKSYVLEPSAIIFFRIVFLICILSVALYIYEKFRKNIYKDLEFMKNLLEETTNSQTEIIKFKTAELRDALVKNPLSHLPNEYALNKKLDITSYSNAMILEIDILESIYDTYGSSIADKLLTKASSTLRKILKPSFELYHINDNKFIILSLEDELNKDVYNHINSIFEHACVDVDDFEFIINFTAALAKSDIKHLVGDAKLALFEAKKSYRKYVEYDDCSEIILSKRRSLKWMRELKEAVNEDKLIPFYQEITSVKNPKQKKYEVLIRIKDGDNFISPFHFLDAASSTNYVPVITKTVINKAFKDFKNTKVELSFNISDDDFYENYLLTFLKHKCERYNIAPSQITLEILENVESFEDVAIIKQITDLREFGVKIAIDDFGAQSSNFARLFTMKPDFIKIDGMFIKNLDKDDTSDKIVNSLCFLSVELGIELVAEFVHNEKIEKIVKDKGIGYLQGNFLHAASPFEDL